jgi:hypothetical protein
MRGKRSVEDVALSSTKARHGRIHIKTGDFNLLPLGLIIGPAKKIFIDTSVFPDSKTRRDYCRSRRKQ